MTPKERVLDIYNTWYENNRGAILANKWSLIDENILWHPKEDTLRGLNLIAYLTPQINKLINNKLLPKLKKVIGKSGWIIPDEGRHITILDIIPHNSGIKADDLALNLGGYKKVISEVLSETKTTLSIGLEGIFASPDGITIQGFPLNDGLANVRETLRREINLLCLTNLEKKKYQLETAHVALIKFTKPLDGKKVLELTDKLRNLPLGDFEIGEMVLNISSRYDKSETIQIIEKLTLS